MTTDGLVARIDALLGSRREARWIAEEVAGLDAVDRESAARAMAERRRTGEPLQYVFGHWPFRELDLVVDARALVPRPETELLVGVALEHLGASRTSPTIACDLGCGSGAIALSLAVEGPTDLEVHATDLDPSALELAAENAQRAGVTTVSFHGGSWYDALPTSLAGRVDLVCSNPPYVSETQRPTLARELAFEPQHALVSRDAADGTPGFAALECVIGGSRDWLSPGGWLVVEHGDGHRDAAIACARRAGLHDIVDLDDLAGAPRILAARRPA